MYPVSQRFLDTVTGPHKAVVRVQVLPPVGGTGGKPQFGPAPTGGTVLPLLAGDVKMSSSADVSATIDITVPGDYWDLIQPYGAELFAERGIDYGDGTIEWVPLGYYGIEEIDQERAPYGPIQISGADRIMRLQRSRLLYPYQVPETTSHRQLFNKLVNGIAIVGGEDERAYGMYFNADVPITFTAYDPDIAKVPTGTLVEDDVYEFLAKLVAGRGCTLRFTRTGELEVCASNSPPGAPAVFAVRSGEGGTLISTSRKVVRRGVYNIVVARGSDPAYPTGYRLAYNNDPASPLDWRGSFGAVARYYASPLLRTSDQADAAAEAVLARYKGLPTSTSVVMVPNPALEPLDVITNSLGQAEETHLVDELTVPLVITGASPVEIVTRTLNEVPTEEEGGEGGELPGNPGTGQGGSAAERYSWGDVIAAGSDDFTTGTLDTTKWSTTGSGITVVGGVLTIAADASGATGAITHKQSTQYGRWEIRARASRVGTTPGGGTPGSGADLSTAAGRYNWGAPLSASDEFDYTGAPDSAKWSVYNGPGHDGNGLRSPSRVTVSGGKMILTGLAGSANTAGLAHKLDRRYGRWEVRCRSFYTDNPQSGGGQTRGVGGIPRPAAGPNVVLETGNRGAFTISTSGTASNPRIYDGGGFTCGRITVAAGTSHVVIQNYRINADGQYGIYINPPGSGSKSHHITIQNCDFQNIHGPGDLNAITFFADDIKILYNTAVNFVTGDPGDSHTDFIQTWNNDPNESSSRVWIIGNKAVGLDPDRPIHQCVMAQGKAATDGGGGGTGDSTDWYIADNEFGAAHNQDIKLEDIDNSVVTRNRFVGKSSRIIEIRSSSTNTLYYSDNVNAGTYGQVGATITAGAGPSSPMTGGSVSGGYHPVLIVWPTDGQWPESGEYDFLENGEPGEQSAGAFMHYPSTNASDQIDVPNYAVDLRQFHNFAFEWTSSHVKGWVDGVPWFSYSGKTAGSPSSAAKNIQDMPSGHLTVQLDAFQASGLVASTMELEWARMYAL